MCLKPYISFLETPLHSAFIWSNVIVALSYKTILFFQSLNYFEGHPNPIPEHISVKPIWTAGVTMYFELMLDAIKKTFTQPTSARFFIYPWDVLLPLTVSIGTSSRRHGQWGVRSITLDSTVSLRISSPCLHWVWFYLSCILTSDFWKHSVKIPVLFIVTSSTRDCESHTLRNNY